MPQERVRPERSPGHHRAAVVTEKPMTKVLIAEGSATDRAALARLLRADPEIAVVGEAAHSIETLEKVKRLRPDIIVMGVHLPASGGFKATKEVMI